MAQSRIIAVYGAKGGLGTSVIAANLALAWAQYGRHPVALVDLDPVHGGCLAGLLNLEGDGRNPLGLGNLAAGAHIDWSAIQPQLLVHPLDVHLLAAPPPDGPVLDSERLATVLTQLTYHYPAVVVDAHHPFISRELVTLFDYASGVLLVVIPDLVAIHHTLVFLEKMHELNFPPQKFYPVLNQAGLTDMPSVTEIESLLKRSLYGQIPYDAGRVVESINRGVPLLQNHASPAISKALRAVADRMRKLPPTDVAKVVRSQTRLEAVQPVRALPAGSGQPEQTSTALTVRAPLAGLPAEERRALKLLLHRRLVEEIVLPEREEWDSDPQRKEEVRQKVLEKLARLLDEQDIKLDSRVERADLIKEVANEALGLGPLEDFLSDPQITEIMVNGPDRIYVEQGGRVYMTDRTFMDEKQLRVAIDRIVAPLGRRVDESSPMVDARLPDGSRVNIVVPPIALQGPTISIRKFPRERLRMVDLLRYGTLNPDMAEFLQASVRARLNIFISGGTSSGKTSTLNVLSSFIPNEERIITIEDAAELKLDQEHVVRMEARPPNLEGTGAVTIRDLVRNSLRQRPDRIIVGEVRGGEAFDMLQAMNTGHDGSLCTGHANAPRDALARVENMVLMAGLDLPARGIREQIASALDLIVQEDRLEDGSRKIVKITEIVGMEGDVITLQDIFVYERRGLDAEGRVLGTFKFTGLRPVCLDKFQSRGVPLPAIFAEA